MSKRKEVKKPVVQPVTPKASKPAPEVIQFADIAVDELMGLLGTLFQGIPEAGKCSGGSCACGSKKSPKNKDLVVIEVQIKDMWKRATDLAFEGLQDANIPCSSEKLLGLMKPFGGASFMREAFKDFLMAMILLDDETYNQAAELVNQCSPFVIVIRKENGDVYSVVSPVEDPH